MRSIDGVGMTPPKVPDTPYPWSSVMISKTLGAPLGGTTLGGQYGLDSWASILIVPPNGAGGFGRYLPSIVVVALGDPGVPVVCCAKVEPAVRARTEVDNTNARMVRVE